MASEKKYPIRIAIDNDGNESVVMDPTTCRSIAAEPAFQDKKYKEIATEYLKRAAAEDPDIAKIIELDADREIFLGAQLSASTTKQEIDRIVNELKAKGYDAEIRMMGDAKEQQ